MGAKKVIKKQEKVQPEVNIGLVGHVDHGKTTLLEALSGKWADTHSEEQKRGITIKLGYADVSFYSCKEHGFAAKKICDKCEFLRKVSFVDAPGHESLMATMLSGAAIMDGALLLVAANEQCPQPQTREHLMALELMGINKIVIVQNKIDLASKERVLENYNQIKEFIKGTIAENASIIPISSHHKVNINYLIQAIQETILTPERDATKKPIMFIARSFDVNRPGTKIDKIVGGVLGGSIKQGMLKVGDKIQIAPGRQVTEKGQTKWVAIKTTIRSINAGGENVTEAGPGGSLGVLVGLDPSIVKSDQLSGSVICKEGELPPLWETLTIKPKLLQRIVGLKKEEKIEPIKKGEPLMINVNSEITAGFVVELKKDKVIINLKRPLCAEIGSKLALSRRIGTSWKLIGMAELGK